MVGMVPKFSLDGPSHTHTSVWSYFVPIHDMQLQVNLCSYEYQ
jgi:hypothetical protein